MEIIATLKEANTEIRRLFLEGNFLAVLDLLIESQNAVIKIGEFIESLEGEGTKTVALLERYYESLYPIAEEIETIDISFYKRLQKQLITIENSIKSEFGAGKIEVAFLPYNASMWDSLESIWLAAKKDPQCDAYCVPIPYYELTRDRRLEKMHYEGADCYDDHVEITNWREYDIRTRRPDVIFIHYAYDDMAGNATIHPEFYSKILREYCECLVYVPYFITSASTIEEYSASLPGVLYANYVMVQSEAIRQSYIRHYKKFNEEHSLNFCFGKAEEKFVAMGSPKLDKAICSNESDYELPLAWRQLICKENGEKKKVIFYNTHMFVWLKNGERYFRKIHSVFETFKNRKDVVLWWRPHPNTELNFRVSRPDLLKEYMKMVEAYKSEGWGIYDDTSDLHRAVAWSDAYYGDGSSVTELFKVTGKPLLLQNALYQPSNRSQYAVELVDFYDDGEYLWFAASNYNALFRMSSSKWEPEYMGTFPGEKANVAWLFGLVVCNNGILFFAPYNAECICTFDIGTKAFGTIELLLPAPEQIEKGFSAFSVGKYVVFTGYSYPYIIRYDTETCTSDYCEISLEKGKMRHTMGQRYFARGYQTEEYLILPLVSRDEIFRYDVQTNLLERIYCGKARQGYYDIDFDGSSFWLAPKDGSAILQWDGYSQNMKRWCEFPKGYVCPEEFGNNNICCVGSDVYLFPNNANMVLRLDTKSGRISPATEFQSEAEAEKDEIIANWFHAKIVSNLIYALTMRPSSFSCYNIQTGQLRQEQILLDDRTGEQMKLLRQAACQEAFRDCVGQGNFCETPLVDVAGFCDFLQEDNLGCCGNAPSTNHAGDAIYAYVRARIG
ncbi:hypothetical protein [Desulfitobacterium hafniense]|uniref:hypothetical protein n=1 Tax=Desulfitobacterium hafniense TaxID=49338 RepID=UPI001A99E397|nr:hypothetical protein [Desulfitobacterium hafniense]